MHPPRLCRLLFVRGLCTSPSGNSPMTHDWKWSKRRENHTVARVGTEHCLALLGRLFYPNLNQKALVAESLNLAASISPNALLRATAEASAASFVRQVVRFVLSGVLTRRCLSIMRLMVPWIRFFLSLTARCCILVRVLKSCCGRGFDP